MNITRCALLALAAWMSGSLPARADDAADVRERLRAASASVHSVVIEMEMSPPGAALSTLPRSISVRTTVATPTRAKVVVVAGPIRIESYQVDGMVYVHVAPGDSWRKMRYDATHPPAQVLAMIRAARNEQISVLPDDEEDGVPVGVVQLEIQLPVPAGMATVGRPVALTCSYDKTTYHLRSCANATMSVTFTKYDDPSNTVDLPPGAAAAVLVVPAAPVPSAATPPPASAPVPSPNPSAAATNTPPL